MGKGNETEGSQKAASGLKDDKKAIIIRTVMNGSIDDGSNTVHRLSMHGVRNNLYPMLVVDCTHNITA